MIHLNTVKQLYKENKCSFRVNMIKINNLVKNHY